eukprot:4506937-Pyramimonas_sp.AAC.1
MSLVEFGPLAMCPEPLEAPRFPKEHVVEQFLAREKSGEQFVRKDTRVRTFHLVDSVVRMGHFKGVELWYQAPPWLAADPTMKGSLFVGI